MPDYANWYLLFVMLSYYIFFLFPKLKDRLAV